MWKLLAVKNVYTTLSHCSQKSSILNGIGKVQKFSKENIIFFFKDLWVLEIVWHIVKKSVVYISIFVHKCKPNIYMEHTHKPTKRYLKVRAGVCVYVCVCSFAESAHSFEIIQLFLLLLCVFFFCSCFCCIKWREFMVCSKSGNKKCVLVHLFTICTYVRM